jgi:hypothetical protein
MSFNPYSNTQSMKAYSVSKDESEDDEVHSMYLGVEADESNDSKMTDNEAFMAYIAKTESD